MRAEEAEEPAPTPVPPPSPSPVPSEPVIGPDRDGVLLTIRSVGQGNVLAEEYIAPVEPSEPEPPPGEYLLHIQIDGHGTVIVEED